MRLGFFVLMAFSWMVNAECITDYHPSKLHLKHSISAEDLKILQQLSATGQLEESWKFLSGLGDHYATLPSKLHGPAKTKADRFYQTLIKTHWQHAVNSHSTTDETEKSFKKFEALHLRQYIEILNSGIWPDSDQILLSQISAAHQEGLPVRVVFDADWIASGLEKIKSWAALEHIPEQRRVLASEVCLEVSPIEAGQVLLEDFSDLPFNLLGFHW